MRLLVLLAVPLVAALAATQSVILPSARATTAPLSKVTLAPRDLVTFIAPEAHTQLAYDTSDIAPVVALWVSLQLRGPADVSTGSTIPLTGTTTVVMGISPRASGTMTTSFAGNLLGATTTTVFSGVISVPPHSLSAWPAPWDPPIPFAIPFLYIATTGSSLIVDLVTTNASGPWIPLEITQPEQGSSVLALAPQPNCLLGNGGFVNGRQVSPVPSLGSAWSISYGCSQPVMVPAFAAFGSAGPGGLWGGLVLPVDLGPWGGLGCSVATSMDLLVPMTQKTANFVQSASIQIPHQPSLSGRSFYDQGIFLDPTANALGIVTGLGSKWTLGVDPGAPGAAVNVWGFGSGTAAIGTLTVGSVITILLN